MHRDLNKLIQFEGTKVVINANGTEEALLVLDELHAKREQLSKIMTKGMASTAENELLAGQVIAIDRAVYQIKGTLQENGLKYIEKIDSTPGKIINISVREPATATEDTEERYRQHLAYLISKTKSRGHSKYYNKFLNKCRAEAAHAYPLGAAAARKKDFALGGIFAALGAIFSFLG